MALMAPETDDTRFGFFRILTRAVQCTRRIGACLLACTLLGWVSPLIAVESRAALRDMAVFLDADGVEVFRDLVD